MRRKNRSDFWYGVMLVLIVLVGVFNVYVLVVVYANRMFAKASKERTEAKSTLAIAIVPTLTPTLVPSPTPLPLPTSTPKPTAIPTPYIAYESVFVTYYGWPDNDPPGRTIAYPSGRYKQTVHGEAGGAGTYDDPVTFAAAQDYLDVGTRIYLPYIRKYAIKEDLCANCGWGHVDVWMESDGSHEAELYACQGHFTKRGVLMEVDPPPGRVVDTGRLFNPSTGACPG